jgi:hypothetical protein
MLKITVSAVLTELPGLDNIELDLGENLTFENADISSSYVSPVASGLRDSGSLSADIIRDPLGAVQQALQVAYNEQSTLASSFTISASGVVLTLSLLVTKLTLSGKRGEGFMGKVEFKLLTEVDWNTADPS